MDVAMMREREKLSGPSPVLELLEHDQVYPAGMWRWRIQGDIAILERATAADWSADEDWIKCDKGNNQVVLLKDLLPAADNTLDLGSAAASFAEAHIQTVVYATSVAGSWSPNADDTYYLGTNALGWVGLFMPDTLIKDDTGKVILRNAADTDYAALECGAVTLTSVALGDDEFMTLGGVASLGFETADANANAVILALPDGGATDVPLFIIGDQSILNADLAAFDGITEPAVAIYNAAGDAYIAVDAGDSVTSGRGIYFKAAADEDVNVIKLSVTGTPTIIWDESESSFAINTKLDFVGGTCSGTLAVSGAVNINDNIPLWMGNGSDVVVQYAHDDANAFAVHVGLPHVDEDANNVACFVLLDRDAVDTDIGAAGIDLNGITEPTLVLGNEATDAWASLDAGDVNGAGRGLYFHAAADEDINIITLSVTGSPTLIWDESEDRFVLSHGLNLGGSLIMPEAGIDLDETLSADGTYCGITCQGVLGDTIVFGELIFLNTADQRWEKALADAEATSGDVMLGLALEGGADGDSKLILLWGFLREDDFNFTSYGQALYIDASTSGDITQTAPSASTNIVRVVGYAHDDADTIFFNPSSTWVEVA